MNLITLDFETFYSREYSLSKLTTESYIRDPMFKVHGVGIKVGDKPAVYYPESEIATIISQLRRIQGQLGVVCHNTRFDGAILAWHYDFKPAMWFDTLSMARAVFPHESGSLANLSKLCGLGAKGTELANFLGVRTLTDVQQNAMGAYCRQDVELTYKLWNVLKIGFPIQELRVIDQTIRLFTEPVLEIDTAILETHLRELKAKKAALLTRWDLTALRSNPQFAGLLREFGVDPPMKISLKTKKETYAFSKTDEGMLALLDHEDENVQLLATARLGVKSSIEETRTEAFLGIARRGALPVPLNYFGAQNTGRDSGAEKINMQNLTKGGALRASIIAPAGKVLVVRDFAAIEARMLAWLAGQDDLVDTFAANGDVYCLTATGIYNRTIVKELHKIERQVGKVAILGAGYQMGGKKFGSYLASGPMGSPPILFTTEDAERMGVGYKHVDPADAVKITTKLKGDDLLAHVAIAQYIIDAYRARYPQIPKYWKSCGRMISDMARGFKRDYGPVQTDENCLWLPNGQRLQYRNLRRGDDEEDTGWRYDGKRGEKAYIYDGKMTENVDQALSCIVMKEAAIKIGKEFKVVMRVHDEVVCCVDEVDAEECYAFMGEVMGTPPTWAQGLPMASEGGYSRSYGDAK